MTDWWRRHSRNLYVTAAYIRNVFKKINLKDVCIVISKLCTSHLIHTSSLCTWPYKMSDTYCTSSPCISPEG